MGKLIDKIELAGKIAGTVSVMGACVFCIGYIIDHVARSGTSKQTIKENSSKILYKIEEDVLSSVQQSWDAKGCNLEISYVDLIQKNENKLNSIAFYGNVKNMFDSISNTKIDKSFYIDYDMGETELDFYKPKTVNDFYKKLLNTEPNSVSFGKEVMSALGVENADEFAKVEDALKNCNSWKNSGKKENAIYPVATEINISNDNGARTATLSLNGIHFINEHKSNGMAAVGIGLTTFNIANSYSSLSSYQSAAIGLAAGAASYQLLGNKSIDKYFFKEDISIAIDNDMTEDEARALIMNSLLNESDKLTFEIRDYKKINEYSENINDSILSLLQDMDNSLEENEME